MSNKSRKINRNYSANKNTTDVNNTNGLASTSLNGNSAKSAVAQDVSTNFLSDLKWIAFTTAIIVVVLIIAYVVVK